MRRQLLWTIAVLLAFTARVQAGIVMGYVAPSTQPPTPPLFLAASNVMSGVTPMNLTRVGLAPVNGAGFYSNGWSGGNSYYTFGFRNVGTQLDLSRLQINLDRPAPAFSHTITLYYREGGNNFFTPFMSTNLPVGASTLVIDQDLSGIAALQNVASAEFAIHSSNYNGVIGITNNNNFAMNAGVVLFDVSPVPEPASTATFLLFVASGAAIACRRQNRIGSSRPTC
jgi:hypothetical protein